MQVGNAQRTHDRAYGHGSLQSLAADVSHHNARGAVRQLEHMVKVSANLTRWQILGVHLESIQLRCTSRHQEHLHFLRRSHLRREPLVALGRSSESQHQRGCNRDEKKQLNRVAGMDGNRVVLEEDCGSRKMCIRDRSPAGPAQQLLAGQQSPNRTRAALQRAHRHSAARAGVRAGRRLKLCVLAQTR